ncbi:hypothetical protein EVC45_22665 [Paraburkholderia sp. UYCP14C]|uniref:hypothetical protein n=1 Tax=Paraburkholderia sp. UYCP14C TaxID=2511130 RepID=UPI0010209394|nr:hypothetical protein [Paraburkholderia sp. UYCP14C]RZF27389.1 hypothetical protein EVC45_22665 [Paraburkholderia sp. UYCP14C]
MTRARGAWLRAARTALLGTLWVLCLAPLAARAASPASAPGGDEITPAERLIFLTDHLHGVAAQTELDYALIDSEQSSRSADVVKVLVLSENNAKGDAQVSDHSGSVNLPIGGLQCNPAIIYFLEHDIAEMQGLTGGQRRYFQQRLRLALAAGPQIESVPSEIGGKPLSARRIVVQPYLNDPNAARFAQYTGKRYTFLLADGVPGEVVQIRTDVPGPNNDFAHPAHTESLSFQSALNKLPSGKAPATKPSNTPRASR